MPLGFLAASGRLSGAAQPDFAAARSRLSEAVQPLCLCLDDIESVAIYTFGPALRYKGAGVYLLYHAQDIHLFRLVHNGDKHLYLLMTVVPLTVDDGHRVYCLAHYAVAYLLALAGEDDELGVLPGAVDQQVECIRIYSQGHIAEYHHPPIVEDGPAGTDDHQVEIEQHSAQRHIAVLVDKRCYHVPSDRKSVV